MHGGMGQEEAETWFLHVGALAEALLCSPGQGPSMSQDPHLGPGLRLPKLRGATNPGATAEPSTSKTNPCISFSMLCFSLP